MIEYINIIKQYALLLFTSSEWHALVMILIIVSAITETAKRVFFIRMTKINKKRWIYGTAFIIGLISGIAGLWLGKNIIPAWFWLVAGVISGPLSNMLHWVTLGVIAWKFPKLAEALKGKS